MVIIEILILLTIWNASISTSTATTTTSSTLGTDVTTVAINITEPCITFNDDIYNFECSSPGRFPNLIDSTCHTYFLCSRLQNGSYKRNEYTCSNNWYFNPWTRSCDISYNCSCADIKSYAIRTTNSTETGTTTESSTTAFLIISESSSITSATTTLPTDKTKAQCIFEEDPNYFDCTETGKHPNLNDMTCQTYFICNLLTNGSFMKTKYSCPNNFHFDPPTQTCTLSYKCPCSDVLFNSTSAATSTENGTTTKLPIIVFLTSEPSSTVSTQTTILTTEITTAQCTFEENSDYFECSTTGRFPNLNDATCQTYFLCNQLRDGSYIKTQYSCPVSSYFNPPIQVCDTAYKCPCSDIISTTTSAATTTETSTTTESPTTSFSTTSEPNLTIHTTNAPLTTRTTTTQCIFEDNSDYFECSTPGRYPNLNDATCQTYFLCNQLRDGSYIKTQYSCPVSSYFNPPIQVCDTAYKCPCSNIISTTKSVATTTETSTTTESPSTSYSTTSEPNLTINTTNAPLTTRTTTTQCIFEDNSDYFECSTPGRFPNLNDATCQIYFLCNKLRDGSYIKTQYSCPVSSYFNPPIQVCDTAYKCPCSEIVYTTTSAATTTETSTTTKSLTTSFSTTSEPNLTIYTTNAPLTTGTTSTQCIFEDNSDYFLCSTPGRYPNLSDATCQTYFLCNQLRDGSYIKTQYSCPVSSYFNPPIQVCDTAYKCPCSEIVSTTTSAATTTETSTTTKSPNTSFSTTSEPNLTIHTTNAPLTTRTTTTQCIFEDNSDYFECSTPGRYPNLNDATCQTYFLCNQLRDGSYIKTQYSCPVSSYFNPPIQVCDTAYKCPCSERVSTTTSAATTTEASTTTESPSTSFSTTSEPNLTIHTTNAPLTTRTTTTQCIFEDNSDYFECSTPGRYPNLNDATCQTYFLCNQLRDGSYIKTQYSCPVSSYFNPPIQVCDTAYKCPCSEIVYTTTSAATTTETSTTTKSPFSTTSEANLTIYTTNAPLSTGTTTTQCIFEQNSDYFECSTTGRFPNLNDATCQTYFLCNKLRDGSYIKTQYSCPVSSYFNPPIQVCDTAYKCPCSERVSTTISAATTTEASTTTESPSTSFSTTSEPNLTIHTTNAPLTTRTTTTQCIFEDNSDYFECSTPGRFPNLNDATCQTYFLCNKLRDGSYIKTQYSCPVSSYFNPPIQVCDTAYKCPCSEIVYTTTSAATTTETSTTTKSPTTSLSTTSEPNLTIYTTNAPLTTATNTTQCIFEDNSDYFECSTPGRYPNLNDATCQTYFLCNQLRDGSYIKTQYSCPVSSYFNPPIQVCDTAYKCPCSEIVYTTTSAATTTETSTTTESPFSTTSEEANLTIYATNAPLSTGTTTTQCIFEQNSDYFECSTTGRFPNFNDATCQTYFLCNKLRDGSYIKTQYSCPVSSYFNPPIQVCDTAYKCPCSDIISTTTSAATTTETSATTESPTTSFSTTSEPNLTIHTTNAPLTTATNITQCIFEDNSYYFECRTPGRYPNLNDATCQTYFLCNQLRDGSYIKTQYCCPVSSYFNPPIQICDTAYKCPCSDIISTTTSAATTTETSTTTESPTTSFSTTSEPNLTIHTTNAPLTTRTTTTQCIFEDNSDYFECSTPGRYPNLNDATCQTYFLCNQLRDGSYIKTQYSCPVGSYFNPPIQVCDTAYKCPCSDLISTTTSAATTTETSTTTESPTTSFSTTSEPNLTIHTTNAPLTTGTTSTQCTFEQNSDYFECSTPGRYPNLNDATCQTYFLCNQLRDGSYIKTQYSCPVSSYFNPPIQVCDTAYRCPCSVILSTTTSAATTTETSTTTESPTTSFSTTSEPNLTIHTTNAPLTTRTTTTQCIFEDNSDYFECSTPGRYPNLNDATCQTYFLCNQLRDGSYIKTQYSCPVGSYFNPPIQVCDTAYKCLCSDIISTTTSAATTTETSTTTESPTTSFSTTSEPNLTIHTTNAPLTMGTTSTQCTFEQNSDYFECSTPGRYPNLNDATCQTYFLCNQLRDGSYIKTQYSCPVSSYFNPPIQVCDTAYRCPCSDILSTTTSAATTTETSTTTESPTTSFSTTSEPNLTIYTTNAPLTTVTTSTQCIFEDNSDYFECSTPGRYPNLNDVTCQTYFLCNQLRDGSYIKTQYSCPVSSYFNPPIQVCDTAYKCPCSDILSTTTSAATTTETSTTTESPITSFSTTSEPNLTIYTTNAPLTTVTTSTQCIFEDNFDYFECSTPGRYPNLNDATCQTYFLCNQLRDGSYIKTQYSCPVSSYFNPPIQVCDTAYKCPCSEIVSTTTSAATTTETSTTTESPTTSFSTTSEPNLTIHTTNAPLTTGTTSTQCAFEQNSDYFECSSTGRFPNLNDATCQTYFLCNLLRDGSYIKTEYSCPDNSYFNPPIQVCDISYKCPCSDIISNITTSTATTETSSTTESTTNSFLTTSESNPTVSTAIATLTSGTTATQCIFENDSEYFECSARGRYPNLNDETCQTYFLCMLLKDKSFIKIKYSCPDDSYFNPTSQVCDVSYRCPCSDPISNVTTSAATTETISTTESTSISFLTTSESNPTVSTTIAALTSWTTAIHCIFENDSDYFECSAGGRFPNLNDETCQTYFLCNQLRDGSYLKTKYSCPDNSYFNPPIQICDMSYKCPCSDMIFNITTPAATTGTSSTTESTATSFLTTSGSSPTVSTTVTSLTSGTTATQCTFENDSDYFVCSERGRYPNLNDATCQTYFLCNQLRDGSYIKTKYSCPDNSYFNPPIQVCDISYKCPCFDIKSTTNASLDFT